MLYTHFENWGVRCGERELVEGAERSEVVEGNIDFLFLANLGSTLVSLLTIVLGASYCCDGGRISLRISLMGSFVSWRFWKGAIGWGLEGLGAGWGERRGYLSFMAGWDANL